MNILCQKKKNQIRVSAHPQIVSSVAFGSFLWIRIAIPPQVPFFPRKRDLLRGSLLPKLALKVTDSQSPLVGMIMLMKAAESILGHVAATIHQSALHLSINALYMSTPRPTRSHWKRSRRIMMRGRPFFVPLSSVFTTCFNAAPGEQIDVRGMTLTPPRILENS